MNIFPVITVRKGSSLKDKNLRLYKGKPLLQNAIEKCLNIFGTITVLADDEEYCSLAKQWGASVPYLDDTVDGNEDVTVRLKKWRDSCNINGRIILIQCTSPNITPSTIHKALSKSLTLNNNEILITCSEFDDLKYSALMFMDNEEKYVKQAIPNIPQISKPRQMLKTLYHYNGAITSFWHEQLDNDSLFDNGNLVPLIIDKNERLDIDKEDDFNK